MTVPSLKELTHKALMLAMPVVFSLFLLALVQTVLDLISIFNHLEVVSR